MRFFQKYSVDEHGFGKQDILFVVSDDYEGIFDDETGNETDIINLETVNKSLNIEEGSFAIDDMTFNISHVACITENDINAMYFCLSATDIKINRYCALFFGTTASLENLEFIGKIHNKVSGKDDYWSGGEYDYEINPLSNYKFTAYSFDISVLQQCSFNSKIIPESGIPVLNIYERFEAENWESIKTIFKNRDAFGLETEPITAVQFVKLGSLYSVIRRYLDLAEEIILELTGTAVNLVLVEGSLGIQTLPQKYELVSPVYLPIKTFATDPDRIKELRLSATESGTNWSVPFIHRKMIDAKLGAPMTSPEDPEEKPKFVNEYQSSQYSREGTYSFRSLTDVATFLYEIARAFGCYLFVSHGSGNVVNFEYKSRDSIVESDYTYIKSAESSDFTTSSILSKEDNQFYGNSGAYAIDGEDVIKNKHNTGEVIISDLYTERELKIKEDKDKNNIESKRLMLTTSPTRLYLSATNNYLTYPINLIKTTGYFGGTDSSWDISNIAGSGYPGSSKTPADPLGWNRFIREYLHTGIYVKSTVSEPEQIPLAGVYPVWRPASQIIVKIGNENKVFNTLSEYCNYVMARDIQYYETEYTIKVPYWNGFSNNSDGSSPSWKNIKLGSKVKLYRTIKKYIDDEWIDYDVESEFVVVSIERNLESPETTLKLHSIERFSFGAWDTEPPPPFIFEPDTIGVAFDESLVSEYLDVAVSQEILTGDVVMINTSKQLIKAENKAEYYHFPIGIALAGGNGGDTIPVQLSGIVTNPSYSFSTAGITLQLRYNESGLNISESYLTSATTDETMITILGKTLSANSFYLQTKSMVLE